jgi:3-oxoacyl-[acyl-carrier-protein] synthase III
MNKVYITNIAKFLPNAPVSNDEMEDILGKINDTNSKSRRLILRNNQITTRYYALSADGQPTHTNADLTALAIKNLFSNRFQVTDINVLSCGTSTPDQLLPSHAAMVHGVLGGKSMEVNSASGVCVSGMNALKYGYMAVKSDMANNAVCTGSERVSTWMQAGKFEAEVENLKTIEEQPIIAFKKDFLRWMLSDGAGAVLLENQPNGALNLEINWMESYSYAYELEACMYAGGDKLEDGSIKPWSNYQPKEWVEQSIFSIKQDVKILDAHILKKGVESMADAMKKHNITPNDIDYFLPHVSSHYFVDGLYNGFAEAGLEITKDKWFMNLAHVGNVGSASIFLMLEELYHSGKLKKGDRIMCSVPESGRFSYAYAYLTVC